MSNKRKFDENENNAATNDDESKFDVSNEEDESNKKEMNEAFSSESDYNNQSILSNQRLLFNSLDRVLKLSGGIDVMLIKGIERNVNNNEDLTQEELHSLRFIVLTKQRQDLLYEKRALILQEQADYNYISLDSSFSKHIFKLVQDEILIISKLNNLMLQFDHVFALTMCISKFDSWIIDNVDQEECNNMVTNLSNFWKTTILIHCNAKLGIDDEYSRLGLEYFLTEFDNEIKKYF
jgi:hypothetical protein